MAYVYICEACLNDDCTNCEVNKDTPPPETEICGGGHCICGHGEPENEWQKSVRENMK